MEVVNKETKNKLTIFVSIRYDLTYYFFFLFFLYLSVSFTISIHYDLTY